MARTYHVEVEGAEYRGTTAPAKEQAEALHMAIRTGVVANLRGEPSDMTLVAMMGAVSYEDVQRFAKLLVAGRIVRDADGVEVAENLFQDQIQNWYLLIGYALRENVGPFWQLQRRDESPKAPEPSPSTDT